MDKKCILGIVVGLSVFVPGLASSACVDDYPMITVTSVGGGQSSSVNGTLTTTFNGHITTTDGLVNRGKNTVKICPGTTVEYAVSSTVGGGLRAAPQCEGVYHSGNLAPGQKLKCNNKNLGGSDTDSFAVKEGA